MREGVSNSAAQSQNGSGSVRSASLLVAMIERLGGEAALVACARELGRVQRLWA